MNKETLAEYKIVYENSPLCFDLCAKLINEKLRAALGREPSCDRTLEGKYVYIGRSDPGSDEKSGIMTYSIKEYDNRIMILCGGAYSALAAFDRLLSLLKEGAEDISVSESLLDTLPLPLSDGGNLRVMTSNILAGRWLCGGRPETFVRAEIYAAHLIKYSPDLIGVQETDDCWTSLLTAYLDIIEKEYKISYSWDQQWVDGGANLTSILYKRDRFIMREHGLREFSYALPKSYKLRVLTWAVFRDSVTERVCALINTHWSGKKEESIIEIDEENYLIRDLETRYKGIRIFCTGDFNMHGNFAFDDLKQATGLICAREAADAAGTLINRITGIRSPICIDHVFTNRAIPVTRYETVDDPPAHVLSDHLPQYADFTL